MRVCETAAGINSSRVPCPVREVAVSRHRHSTVPFKRVITSLVPGIYCTTIGILVFKRKLLQYQPVARDSADRRSVAYRKRSQRARALFFYFVRIQATLLLLWVPATLNVLVRARGGLCICRYICIHIYIYVCVCVCVYIHICSCCSGCPRRLTCWCVQEEAYVYVDKYIYTYIYMYICVCVCIYIYAPAALGARDS